MTTIAPKPKTVPMHVDVNKGFKVGSKSIRDFMAFAVQENPDQWLSGRELARALEQAESGIVWNTGFVRTLNRFAAGQLKQLASDPRMKFVRAVKQISELCKGGVKYYGFSQVAQHLKQAKASIDQVRSELAHYRNDPRMTRSLKTFIKAASARLKTVHKMISDNLPKVGAVIKVPVHQTECNGCPTNTRMAGYIKILPSGASSYDAHMVTMSQVAKISKGDSDSIEGMKYVARTVWGSSVATRIYVKSLKWKVVPSHYSCS